MRGYALGPARPRRSRGCNVRSSATASKPFASRRAAPGQTAPPARGGMRRAGTERGAWTAAAVLLLRRVRTEVPAGSPEPDP